MFYTLGGQREGRLACEAFVRTPSTVSLLAFSGHKAGGFLRRGSACSFPLGCSKEILLAYLHRNRVPKMAIYSGTNGEIVFTIRKDAHSMAGGSGVKTALLSARTLHLATEIGRQME
jgi:hypothetical protein